MPKEEEFIEAEFIVLEEREYSETLECPRCGTVFDVDAMDEEEKNLVWSWKKMAFCAVCPLCGTRQS